MHSNSLAAREMVVETLNERELAILHVFHDHDLLTDRDVAYHLGIEVTSSRPRITELCKAGLLHESGTIKERGRSVRLCQITFDGVHHILHVHPKTSLIGSEKAP